MADMGDVVMSPPVGATVEIEELQVLIADAHERGSVAAGVLSAAADEAELSLQQTGELMSYLEEHGIEVLGTGEGPTELDSTHGEATSPGGEQPPDEGEREIAESHEERESRERSAAVQMRLEELRRRDVDLTIEASLD
jgi:hypothetical protein